MANDTTKGLETMNSVEVTEVPKEFFFDGMILPVDIYLKIKDDNYLVIGRKADKANFATLHAFQHKDARIFVKNPDHPILVKTIRALTGKIIQTPSVPLKVKNKFVAGLLDDALNTLEKANFVSIEKLQVTSKLMIEMISTAGPIDDLLQMLTELPTNQSKHAMATSLVSLLIAEEMGITQSTTLEKIALGSICRDIGLKFVPRSILEKPKHLWSSEDLQAYEHHPIKGVEVLRGMRDISMEVLLIVAEHHENAQGTGFPKKVREIKLSPLSKIVALADFFTDVLIMNESSKSYTSDEAILYIVEVLGQPFNKQAFTALKNVINKKAFQDAKKRGA